MRDISRDVAEKIREGALQSNVEWTDEDQQDDDNEEVSFLEFFLDGNKERSHLRKKKDVDDATWRHIQDLQTWWIHAGH